jgi:hypothetical protein
MRFHLVVPALAGLALACPSAARAADVPSGPRTGATLPVRSGLTAGTFEVAGDSDWYRVRLEQGRDYAFLLDSQDGARLRLRDAGGRILQHRDSFAFDENDGGFEYRAERTGTYFVEAVQDASASADPSFNGYHLRVTQDCQDDLSTRCTLGIGEEKRQQQLTWSADSDFLRVTLQRGQTYTVQLDAEIGARLQLRDQHREVVASKGAGAGATARITGFRAAYTGSYFVNVTGGGALGDVGGGSYRVGIRRP